MWSNLIILSALTGAGCGLMLTGRRAVIWGAGIPWVGMLAWLLYHEYFVPYSGGGASMWPVAQLIAGTVAAAVGGMFATAFRGARAKFSSWQHLMKS